MKRRQALRAGLAGIGFAVGSGCLGSSSDEFRTEGDDDTPLEAEPEALLLPAAALREPLEEGWTEEDDEDVGMFNDADAARQYVPFHEENGFHMESGVVTTGVWFFDDVETARETYRDHPYQEGWGFEERKIAVESIGGRTNESSELRVIFRDANVIGGVHYDNGWIEDDAREELGLELAALMHERWRDDEDD